MFYTSAIPALPSPKMSRILSVAASIALSVLSMSALAERPVEIRFVGHINGTAINCGETYQGLGTPPTDVRVSDYRMFISEPALVRANGSLEPIRLIQDGKWQYETVALLDFENGTGACNGNGSTDLNTTVRGTVPSGDYVGLSFNVGVPFDLNHGDPTLASAPLNSTAMFWNWQNGYRFVRIDLVPLDMPSNGAKGWFLHLGSTQCAAPSKTQAPSKCANPNRMMVKFDQFDLEKNVVAIDPAPVLKDVNLLSNAQGTSPGCMSFPGDSDCDTVMPRLGLPYGDIPAQSQLLLTVQ